ncbi:MAG: sugar phosphate isomerase/epimerase family protein [Candidatus Thorarchaeota archaeon]
MEIGTFARTTKQVQEALSYKPDFIELRLDVGHDLDLSGSCSALKDSGVRCTIHLPSNPDWRPIELSQGLLPYIDIGRRLDADLVTIHTTLSSLFYRDEDIDTYLTSLEMAYDAAVESGVPLAVETLGLYYTELRLLFDDFPGLKLVLDLGHGQLLATHNRAFAHIETFDKYIAMVNVHDNRGMDLVQEVLEQKKKRQVSREEMRELALNCDTHLPIGKGKIDFLSLFKKLKQHSYDGKFLLIGGGLSSFDTERETFLELWRAA